MLITTDLKTKILEAVKENFALKNSHKQKYSQSRHACWLGINSSVYSRLSKGVELDRLLSDNEWVRVGKQLMVDLDGLNWQTAQTTTYTKITKQLKYCMNNSLCGIFCDDSSIGKTWPAKKMGIEFANVAYVDCSGLKTWSKLIRGIARAFGFTVSGTLFEIRQQVIDNILALDKPLIILDESGDINDAAILELKGLWNELEYMCGWYLLGANGLRSRMENKVRYSKVGFEELFNRVGGKYQSSTEGLTNGKKEILKRQQIESVIKLNAPTATAEQVSEMVASCEFNQRRARIEVMKFKSQFSKN